MLNRKEKAVMWIVYNKAIEKNKACIITEEELLSNLNPKLKIQDGEIQKILELLEYDGYYELTNTEKKDQPVMVINLRQKGQAFPREMVQEKRQIIQRTIMSVAFSVLGAIAGVLIRSIF